jgi:hypothetical protein
VTVRERPARVNTSAAHLKFLRHKRQIPSRNFEADAEVQHELRKVGTDNLTPVIRSMARKKGSTRSHGGFLKHKFAQSAAVCA